MPEGFWRARDPRGLVHHMITVPQPVLMGDNNVDYHDSDVTFCDEHAGDWPEVPADEATTCVQCLSAWLKFVTAALVYHGTKSGRLSSDG